MPKRAAGLTARGVVGLTTPGLFADGGGLYLQISPAGTKSWVFRFSLAGRRRDMGLGPVADVTLAQARELAATARKLVREGQDPIEARRQRATDEAGRAITLREAASTMIRMRQDGWRNAKHAAQWTASLERYVFPLIGDRPVAAVSTDDLVRVLEPIWSQVPETASRIRGRIEATLDYARVRNWRTGENPARWRGHLDQVFPAKGAVAKVEHHASLPYSDLPAFWVRLQIQDGLGARALELAILTAGRTGEVLGARWEEFDLGAALWTVPAARMKTNNPHRVPLCAPALQLLRKLHAIRIGDLVFPGARIDRPLSNMAIGMVLRRMAVPVTVHGFRSTFRVWVEETTNTPVPVSEAALSHTIKDKVMAAYQRSDLLEKRRPLMEAWGTFVTSTVTGKAIPGVEDQPMNALGLPNAATTAGVSLT
jgi:integrase